MERPKLTKELIAATAEAFCKSNGWQDDEADDLAKVCTSLYMDGYEIAKALESRCYWTITTMEVETLDEFSFKLREALRQACITWARENNIQPPHPIGTKITRGTITGIYEHDGACYLVAEPGKEDSSTRLVVRFEDAIALNAEPVAAV